jgi:hypothetical protein
MQLKGGVQVCVGDQIAVGAVVQPRCEYSPQHSECLDVGPFFVGRHTVIVNARDHGVGEASKLCAGGKAVTEPSATT